MISISAIESLTFGIDTFQWNASLDRSARRIDAHQGFQSTLLAVRALLFAGGSTVDRYTFRLWWAGEFLAEYVHNFAFESSRAFHGITGDLRNFSALILGDTLAQCVSVEVFLALTNVHDALLSTSLRIRFYTARLTSRSAGLELLIESTGFVNWTLGFRNTFSIVTNESRVTNAGRRITGQGARLHSLFAGSLTSSAVIYVFIGFAGEVLIGIRVSSVVLIDTFRNRIAWWDKALNLLELANLAREASYSGAWVDSAVAVNTSRTRLGARGSNAVDSLLFACFSRRTEDVSTGQRHR